MRTAHDAEDAAPALVPLAAVTVAVTSGRSVGFLPAATHRRAEELLRDLLAELADQGVRTTGCASVSVVSVDDVGVGVEVGVVVQEPVVTSDTLRLVERPGLDAVTLLVRGEQTDHAWQQVHRHVEAAGLVPHRRAHVSFLHPRGGDPRDRHTLLVQPVGPRGR